MTVDPSKPVTEEPATSEETAEKPEGEKPAAAAPPALDVDAIAEAVISKLATAAEKARPATPAVTERPDTTSYDEMLRVVNAGDKTHPLYDTYNVQLQILRRQGEEDEWGSLGCGVEHPARALFRANPGAYAGMPRFAYQEWYIQQAEKKKQDEAAEQKKAEKEKEASRAVRESAPGMPSRSVGGSTRSGKLQMTHADFERRVENEPDLDDKLDRGLIVFTD